jgi:predicted GNAT family N-acyltransferase
VSRPPPGAADEVAICPVPVQAVLPLRQSVLRPGRPVQECTFEPDLDPATVHLAAVDAAGDVLGCATWFAEPWQGAPAWRLRGMATAPAARGVGLGGRLIEQGLALARDAGVGLVWCNARTTAVGFYRRYGFETVGEEFLSAQGIPHFVMRRPLP